IATAKMIYGIIIGVTNKLFKMWRPRKFPRTTAYAMGIPKISDRNTTGMAIRKLFMIGTNHSVELNNCLYHSNVNPGGGNSNHVDVPNDRMGMTIMGINKNNSTRLAIKYNATRPNDIRFTFFLRFVESANITLPLYLSSNHFFTYSSHVSTSSINRRCFSFYSSFVSGSFTFK